MANLLYKLGTFIAKHKWLSIIIWLVVLGVVIAPLLVTSPKFDSDIKMNGLKSLIRMIKSVKNFIKTVKKRP